jgi:periplasmic protein TonB
VSSSSLRLGVAALLSALLTAGVFAALRALTNARTEAEVAMASSKVEFVRLRREVEIEERKREKPEREKPEQELVTPTLAVAEKEGLDLGLDVQAIAAGLGAEFGSAAGTGGAGRGELALTAGLSDRAPLPLVRVEPQYPPQAARKGLEGWVKVQFTISTAGSVRDAVVVESSDSVFERAAINAVNKWKYQPQMKAGKPVETSEIRVVVRFRMES